MRMRNTCFNNVRVNLFAFACGMYVLFLHSGIFAQADDRMLVKEIRGFYHSLDEMEPGSSSLENCGPVRFIRSGDSLSVGSDRIKSVFIIRHNKPNLHTPSMANYKQILKYRENYDLAGVIPVIDNPVCLDQDELKQIYCSTLPRSMQTAAYIAGDKRVLLKDTVFREFNRGMLKIPFVYLPAPVWGTITSIYWMLGGDTGAKETYREARSRARSAARKIEDQAEKEQNVVLVAHGFFNQYLIKNLKKSGWKRVRKGGSGYLGTHVLVKISK